MKSMQPDDLLAALRCTVQVAANIMTMQIVWLLSPAGAQMVRS